MDSLNAIPQNDADMTTTLVANVRTTTNMLEPSVAEIIQKHYINPIYSAKVPIAALQQLIQQQQQASKQPPIPISAATASSSSNAANRTPPPQPAPMLHSMMMTHPVSLNLSTFASNVLPNINHFKIADKNDGIRVWLILTRDLTTQQPFACLVNRAGNIWMVENLVASDELHNGTIVDGELLTAYDPEGYTYCMFDAISFAGVDLTRSVEQKVRMHAITVIAKIIKWPDMRCIAKKWYSLGEYVARFPSWEDFDRHISSMNQTDGLILSHVMSGAVVMPTVNYKGNTPNHVIYPVYKLKASQTIDLWVMKRPLSVQDVSVTQDGDDHSCLCYMSDDQKMRLDSELRAHELEAGPMDIPKTGCGCCWISSHTFAEPTRRTNHRHWVMRNLQSMRTEMYEPAEQMAAWLHANRIQLNNPGDAALIEFTVIGVTTPPPANTIPGLDTCTTVLPNKSQHIDMRPLKLRKDKARANNERTINNTLQDISGNCLSMDLFYGLLVKQTMGAFNYSDMEM